MRVAEFPDRLSHITWFELHSIPVNDDKYTNSVNTWKLYIYIVLYLLYYIIYK